MKKKRIKYLFQCPDTLENKTAILEYAVDFKKGTLYVEFIHNDFSTSIYQNFLFPMYFIFDTAMKKDFLFLTNEQINQYMKFLHNSHISKFEKSYYLIWNKK